MTVTGIENKVIAQVCIIVNDVEKTAEHYRKILGWKIPDEVQITRLHEHTNAKYFGEPTDARAKIIGFNLGEIQFEFLQPLEPPSSWQDYLDEHGEGIHHIAFFVPKTEPTAQSFVEHGYQITQEGLFTGRTGKYTYLDTDKDMGIVIELLEHFNGSPTPKSAKFPQDKGIGTDIVCQVGIVVNDIEATSQRIAEVLGLPPPPIHQTSGGPTKLTYQGQPTDAVSKLVFFNLGQVRLELVEPNEKPSVSRNYLNEKGQGANHIAFQITDTQKVTDYLAQYNIGIIQQGIYSSGNGMYTHMDSSELLGTTIVLLENF